jgi:hypothetical protein
MQKSFGDFCENFANIFALYLGIASQELGLNDHVNPLLMDGFRLRENKYAKILQLSAKISRETIFALYLGIAAGELGLDDHINPFLMDHSGAALHGRGRGPLLALALAAHQVDQVGLLVAEQVNKQLASHVREADLREKKVAKISNLINCKLNSFQCAQV